jgi:ribosomal protein S27AE
MTDLVDELPQTLELSEESIQAALDGEDILPVVQGDLETVKEKLNFLLRHNIAGLILPDENHPQRVLLAIGRADQQAAADLLGNDFKKMIEEEGLTQKATTDLEQCPACGHKVALEKEECPECGLFVGSPKP